MATTVEEIRELLHEGEGTALDYKREPYPFVNEPDDGKKSELLKDILAFANAWRRSDAFILIGVEPSSTGPAKIVGSGPHPDDASVQQFINGKTQRPISFSYEVVQVDGASVGVIRISAQKRPFFVRKAYGKVLAGVVYIRRGSSTAIATPDEVAEIGAATVAISAPQLEIMFGDPKKRSLLGASQTLEATYFAVLTEQEAAAVPIPPGTRKPTWDQAPAYFQELSAYIAKIGLLNPVALAVRNLSPILASGVRAELEVARAPLLTVVHDFNLPQPPPQYSSSPWSLERSMPRTDFPRDLHVDELEDRFIIHADFGRVQPGAVVWIGDEFWVGSRDPGIVTLSGSLFADNLPEPQPVTLSLTIVVEDGAITAEQFYEFARSG